MSYKRSKRSSDFAGSTNYGKCASRNLHYFGYKLVTITTLSSVPIVYDLVPAKLDEPMPFFVTDLLACFKNEDENQTEPVPGNFESQRLILPVLIGQL